jgi:dephospho-CoA kinase
MGMLKIGITGGIGTGKTTACEIFEKLGVPVYYADDRAKWLQNNQPEVIAALKALFGAFIYKDGILDRAAVGSIVFTDKEKLEKLNAIVHPAVFQDSENWQEQQRNSGKAYTLKEAALLFETGSNKQLDKIIVVSAPLELRVKRVMQRDTLSREEVLKRISSQMPQEEKENLADFVIQNEDLKDLEDQIKSVHEHILLSCK